MYVCMSFISLSCTDNEDSKIDGSEVSSEQDQNAPNGLVSPERMIELSNNWTKTRAKVIKNAIGTEDNRSVKFYTEDLKTYLEYAEKQSEQLGYNMTGVRIYFGAYGKNKSNGKAGQATVFLTPTGTRINNTKAGYLNFFTLQEDDEDTGGDGLNHGGNGEPPGAEYPQLGSSKDNGSRMSNKSIEKPSGLISPERMVELGNNWDKTRASAIEVAIGKRDNRSMNFSLDEIRKFLDYAEIEANDLGYVLNGVRVYFAAYGNEESNGKEGYATVFIAPTGYRVGNSKANMLSPFFQVDSEDDILGGGGLNMAGNGMPPGVNYPQ